MGDIADSIIDGEFDCETGEYIGEPCGYPRTMNGSSRRSKSKRPYTGHKSVESAFNGVARYVQLKYSNLLEKTSDPNKMLSQIRKLQIRYLSESGIEHDKRLSHQAGSFNANIIQNDFKSFVNFLKQASNEKN